MPSADDRIVRMEFDNASFERKINSTLVSLSQLDKALKFTGASKGLSDVGAAAEKVNFSHMGNAIEDVSKKFLALSTIAITALANITTHALRAGANIAKAFTIAPIIDGFREYETQLNSVQTILANTASKGTTLDQVNDALQRLNEYSDQTIYNFGQMARNIGTFTAAGVDLDTSVQSIKGIANLAAMSGSNAEQASNAMYQLSQAIATGSLKLIDWNSVVNAGMGGEAFKSALFETGKAMGTLLDVPLGQTFKEWEDSGHSFRESLQDEWITAEVLTTTLAGFTGDLTEEMLIMKGFSQDAASQIVKTAAIAKAAATEVKTFTQLVGTVKEAVGTGWADSFKIIIGNFTEAKELWTGVNNSIGAFVKQNADARNEMLEGWKAFGGRTSLIESFKTAFSALGDIIAPIREAFHNIFPPATAETLLRMTDAFRDFTQAMVPSQITIDKIRIIFQGLFSALSIGWTILKEGTQFIVGLAKSLLSLVTPEASNFLVKLGAGLSDLQGALVKGGGIQRFFEGLTKALEKPLAFLVKIKEAIGSVFDRFNSSVADRVSDSVDRVGSRFENLKEIFAKLGDIWAPLENGLSKVAEVLGRVWDYMVSWVKELGSNLAKVMGPGDFNAFLDVLNTTFLGGIVLLLRKFFKSGFKLDLGGGLFEKISGILDQVTGSLKAMQMNVKANAIMKIAGAIAILTASVLVLSSINSADLTKALTAMAVGFGELMATFSVFTKIMSTPMAAASFTLMSTGLIALSTALLIMSGAVKVLGSMKPEQLAKGLGAVAGLLAMIVGVAYGLGKTSGSLIAAGVGITALAIGLTILMVPIKVFSKMKWEEIGKGMVGLAGALLIIAGAMQLMPATLPITAAGLILVGIGLGLIAGVIAIFGNMKWGTIGKGLVAMGGGLLVIAGAMQLMPATLPITAAGLILVGIALVEIAGAMKLMGKMSWAEIGRGLAVMAGAMLILAAAMYAMTGSIVGAVALIIVANALVVLAAALKLFGKMDFGDILTSLLKVALALGAFALIAVLLQPATGAMLALGAALVVLGVGFALIGGGAYLVAKAFETFAKAGKKGVEVIGELVKVIAESIPKLAVALAKGIVDMIEVIAKAAPEIAESLGKLLGTLLDQLIILIPKAEEVIKKLIGAIIRIIRAKAPDYIELGFFILTKLLEGIRNNIENITAIVGEIIVKFVEELSKQLDAIVEAVAELFRSFFLKVSYELGKTAATILVGTGKQFLKGFLDGVEEQAPGLLTWFQELPGKIVGWIGDVARTIWEKGTSIIGGFFGGIIEKAWEVIQWFIALPGNIFSWVGDTLGTLKDKGLRIIEGFWNGVKEMFESVKQWFGNLPEKIVGAISGMGRALWDIGVRLMEGLLGGIKDGLGAVKDFVGGIADKIIGWKGPPDYDAVILIKNGLLIMQGLQVGLERGWMPIQGWLGRIDPSEHLNDDIADNMAKTVNAALRNMMDHLDDDIDMSPVITPVIDLTKIREGASQIAGYMAASSAYQHAQVIATQKIGEAEHIAVASTSSDVNFQQIINAPTQLSTSDIYKHTRNQITMAKEELSIP